MMAPNMGSTTTKMMGGNNMGPNMGHNMGSTTTKMMGGRRTRRHRGGAASTLSVPGGAMPAAAATAATAAMPTAMPATAAMPAATPATAATAAAMMPRPPMPAAPAAPAATATPMRGGARKSTVGSKAQVWHGTAAKTVGGLTKKDLMKHKGRIVSRKKHALGKKAFKRLVKAGFKPKRGTFKLFRK
jgi:hypothetical protein